MVALYVASFYLVCLQCSTHQPYLLQIQGYLEERFKQEEKLRHRFTSWHLTQLVFTWFVFGTIPCLLTSTIPVSDPRVSTRALHAREVEESFHILALDEAYIYLVCPWLNTVLVLINHTCFRSQGIQKSASSRRS